MRACDCSHDAHPERRVCVCLKHSVFFLAGKTSTHTMNVASVIKDWLLIGLSSLLFHAKVTPQNLRGCSIAFAGVCWYN